MDEDTEPSPQSHISGTSKQHHVTAMVLATNDSTSSPAPQTNTEMPKQEATVLFLNVMVEEDDIRINHTKTARTISPREGIP